MNNKRRKEIKEIIDKLSYCKDYLEKILSDEEDSYESMGEGLQCSEVGEVSEEAQEHLSETIELLDNAVSELEEI